MLRPRQIWLIFGTALVVAAAAVVWISVRAWRSDRAETIARQQAVLEENVRLALWRMDSALAPFLAQENARPFEAFQSPVPIGQPLETRRLLQPPQIRLYFWSGTDGTFGSPDTSPAKQALLAELQPLADWENLRATLPAPAAETEVVQLDNNPNPDVPAQPAQQITQQSRGASEYRARSQYLTMNNTVAATNFGNGIFPGAIAPGTSRVGSLRPVVLGDHLLLVRRVDLQGGQIVQGACLDWHLLRGELLANVTDLLPAAQLHLSPQVTSQDEARLLASLPVRLEPGAVPLGWEPFSPVALALILAWGLLFLAAAAVAALLSGVVALSERRADFVSAVTHELRTPLTTFRLYAEMLAEGMLPDEATRSRYLETLRLEAERLTHLVENVLAYARLERGGLGNRIQSLPAETLLSAATERLGERASQAGLELAVDAPPAVRSAMVQADPSAVEQILFNLVDNACKYAACGRLQTLTLELQIVDRKLRLRLRDFGPGISTAQRRKLFQPFRRSAEEAAQSAPGVGLGLSLSRRLARDMKGDLWLDASVTDGAAFVLELPLSRGLDYFPAS